MEGAWKWTQHAREWKAEDISVLSFIPAKHYFHSILNEYSKPLPTFHHNHNHPHSMNTIFKRCLSSLAPVKGMKDLVGVEAWRYSQARGICCAFTPS